jgi:hypothetical protein
MKPAQVKAWLFENKTSAAKMARELLEDYPIGYDSLRVMVGDVLFARRAYPRLAAMIKETYGLEVEAVKNSRKAVVNS